MSILPLRTALLLPVLLTLFVSGPAPARGGDVDYEADIRFALEELEKKCGHFFKLKEIDWKKVSKAFVKDAKKVETDSDHLVLLVRLLARIEDGHARVNPLEKGKEVKWPDDGKGPRVGPGMFLCRVGKKIYVKTAWSSAAGSGIKPGMEIVKIDGKPALKWLDAKREELSDTRSFSTDHHAYFYTLHRGLALPSGSRLELEVKDLKGKKKKRTVTYNRASVVPNGPAFYPGEIKTTKDLRYTTTEAGWGYIHVRRSPGDLPEQMDEALGALGNVPGLILDYRGNSGGGFDHDGFMGRFVPEGKTLAFGKTYRSAGPGQYGGPIVVIVSALTVSAGETGAGMFKEDGRGYLIGESPTAGMSSSKTTIDLPSGLFQLYVSVRSNKSAFNKGRGIEGIGVIPHEIVEFDPDDLAAEKDTLTLRAEALLKKYPKKEVPYDPAKFGWKK